MQLLITMYFAHIENVHSVQSCTLVMAKVCWVVIKMVVVIEVVYDVVVAVIEVVVNVVVDLVERLHDQCLKHHV